MSAFLDINKIWLLLGLVPLAFILYKAEGIRRTRLSSLGYKASSHVALRLLAPIIIISLSLLALTRPYSGYDEIELRQQGSDTMIVFDISLSMLSKDISPNRLEFAKRKVLDFIRILEAKSPGDRVGIVLFSGAGYLFCPLTSDYSAVSYTHLRCRRTP